MDSNNLSKNNILDNSMNNSGSWDKNISFEDIRNQLSVFAKERDWDQYHAPRNLILAMMGEVGELCEIFQWKGEVSEGLLSFSNQEKDHVSQEISDIICYLIRLADRCSINLPVAILNKIQLNCKKYPSNIVKGSSKKYSEYHFNNS